MILKCHAVLKQFHPYFLNQSTFEIFMCFDLFPLFEESVYPHPALMNMQTN